MYMSKGYEICFFLFIYLFFFFWSFGCCHFKGFGFTYLTPLIFFLHDLNSSASSVSVDGCKGILEGKNKRDQDTF